MYKPDSPLHPCPLHSRGHDLPKREAVKAHCHACVKRTRVHSDGIAKRDTVYIGKRDNAATGYADQADAFTFPVPL